MEKEQIKLSDWQRLLFGDAPVEFTLEVVGRTLFTYVVLLLILRWLGKRMHAQLTVTEMAVMVTLGGIVSVAMQVPDRGLLPSVLVLLGCLLLQRGSNWLAFKSRRAEVVLQGDVVALVKDGVLQLPTLQHYRISREELFAQLRASEVWQLGEVARAYLEANGTFSVFTHDEPVPGLSLLPEADAALRATSDATQRQACARCGTLSQPTDHTGGHCRNCQSTHWEAAVC
ncbi:DUF421 domain-containing protein [Hymenobacter aerilatus]|uniref:DUF421 domain-containing protein n=1 Tax=Hymenobacter aerilatus TaxID=2932251 RepID=A0A8T9SYU1_9BACT|nr:YetF domain-containing protein [Hymenobacter aerilatus]UOR06074.1 DUF421 domain-containing protein [Hymenobacter aerilatus]